MNKSAAQVDLGKTIESALESSRRNLLDMSARNRLLAMPLGKASSKSLEAVGANSDNVFKTLVREKKALRFTEYEQVNPRVANEVPESETCLSEKATKQADTKLVAKMSKEKLDKQLLSMYRNTQTIIEEQGVNILYLALGSLTWTDGNKSAIRHAPLLMIPVQLSRQASRQQFQLRWSGADVEGNLSLQAKLKQDRGIDLPMPEIDDDFIPSRYFPTVQQATANLSEWSVDPDCVVLGFFSFAKLLMYKDLDSHNWPDPEHLQKALSRVLQTGYAVSDSPLQSQKLDDIIPVDRLDYVVDADSSQTIAIERVRSNESLVFQGPPGTGKSQTITNLIATAVLDGKKVLFVSEKNAALDVVLSRLQREGLGDLCLKLHSNISRAAVLEAIDKTWHLGAPKTADTTSLLARLTNARDHLNAHTQRLHLQHEPSGLSFFQAIGVLTRLGGKGHTFGSPALPGCETWTPEDYRARQDYLQQSAQRAIELGNIREHTWCGVQRTQILQIDLPPLQHLVHNIEQAIPEAQAHAREVSRAILGPECANLRNAEEILRMAQHALRMPRIDPISLAHSGWDRTDKLREIIHLGKQLDSAKAGISQNFRVGAEKTDASKISQTLETHGSSFWRSFNKEYRQAISQLKGLLRVELPRNPAQRLALGRLLEHYQTLARSFFEKANDADFTFGFLWNGRHSDWTALESAVEWVSAEPQSFVQPHQRSAIALQRENRQFAGQVTQLEQSLQHLKAGISQLAHELELDTMQAFGVEDAGDVAWENLCQKCQEWRSGIAGLPAWCNWVYQAKEARQAGLESFVNILEGYDSLQPSLVLEAFERQYHEHILRAMVEAQPALARFESLTQDRLVEEFRTLDRERMQIAKHRVLEQHHSRMPARIAGAGYAGILLGELQRSRGQRTLRRLMLDVGPILQDIKPVFMMSPLAVAQYLVPGKMEFDLLIIDEASQVSPVDALGAFARTRQHIVVGDQKQLPPTRFFERLTGNYDDDVEDDQLEAVPAKDMESILSLCCARMPTTTLRWHYRSRHHSLIAVSNQEFYSNQLFIVPSPYTYSDHLGVKFHWIEKGLYDRGRSATNRVEAEAIAQAVIAHAQQYPDKTLGVAAFSINQQTAIRDAIDHARKSRADLDGFFEESKTEAFFVKNLETIQGDERDVIFISVGFGKDSSNRVTMNFGPLNGEHGARRLNVLISRARERCEVFSSIKADEIRIDPGTGRGPQVFKTFLHFAETGNLSSLPKSQGDTMSPFEDAVRQALEFEGYVVHPQVGVAGFFIDLGVVDPSKPGRYILGIECDGASYHASLSARDRDRLRQSVLENQGWNIHRIWSTEWFQKPEEQLRRAIDAIQGARCSVPSPVPDNKEKPLERDAAVETLPIEEFPPYTMAGLEIPRTGEPHSLAPRDMAEVVSQILALEGPVHQEEVIVRVREHWGMRRAGRRTQHAILQGIRELEANGGCQRESDFLWLPSTAIRPRSRRNTSSGLRRPERIPPVEIQQGILIAIERHPGIRQTELIDLIPRMFGYRAATDSLRHAVSENLDLLKNKHTVHEENGILSIALGSSSLEPENML